MPAPTGSNGVSRAVAEVLSPSIGVIIAVVFTKAFLGGLAAGLVYLILMTGIVAGLLISAQNWNIRYTAGFIIAGFVFMSMMPSLISELIHPVFAGLGTVIWVVGFIMLFGLLAKKLGLKELIP